MAAKEINPEIPKVWILAATDFSEASRLAVLRARQIAHERGAELLVLHVINTDDVQELAHLTGLAPQTLKEKLTAERRERLTAFVNEAVAASEFSEKVPTDTIVSWGRPYAEILRKAVEFDVDLVVLGLAGRSADLEHALFGSTAERVLRAARCEVLCIPLVRS